MEHKCPFCAYSLECLLSTMFPLSPLYALPPFSPLLLDIFPTTNDGWLAALVTRHDGLLRLVMRRTVIVATCVHVFRSASFINIISSSSNGNGTTRSVVDKRRQQRKRQKLSEGSIVRTVPPRNVLFDFKMHRNTLSSRASPEPAGGTYTLPRSPCWINADSMRAITAEAKSLWERRPTDI